MKPTICFSHANSFPAGTYRLLFETWQDAGWQVIAPPCLGHDAAFPVTRNWPHLLEELASFIQQHAHGQPLHLVGHSLGGFLSLLLACQTPGLKPAQVRRVVLLDSPVIAGWRSHGAAAARAMGLYQRIGGAHVALQRRHRWPSSAAALAHFAAKPAFARWDKRVLADYITSGLQPDPEAGQAGAVRLRFQREVEAAIYNSLPLNMGAALERLPPAAQVHFIGGRQSTELRRAGLAATRALVRERLHWVDGTHLFPMEKPQETAQAVLRCLGG